ncbi:uncharacterized protein N7496_007356 [Penicillium cataractarum]|uniref:Uncharacterized protein n=1 Tax=Penicillium cataractarum TaxID=2100454 RepID=A0A9W9S5D2_9EURO|nr:uncharacterized protein N7496_007356 [Penicillium cataractarum]KAJ5371264.1 hypothetical protein N7496_007356 [Penicillium cataractarum]
MKKPGSRVAASQLDAHQAGPPGADEVGSGDVLPAGALSPVDPDQSSPSYQRSNAFFMMWERGEGLSRLPRKSSGTLNPASPQEQSTPGMTRKYSGLDYDGELALPMPKPRVRGEHAGDEKSSQGVDIPRPSSHPRLLKKRSVPDAARAKAAAELVTSADGKKPTRLEAIKSKFSFKDLRKEAAKGDSTPTPVPRMPSIEKQSDLPRSTTGSGTAGLTPSVHNFRPTPQPGQTIKASAIPATSPASPSQHSTAPSRIPLAPSGPYAHAQGSMTASRFGAGQRVDSWGQVKTIAERVESKEVPTTTNKGSIPIPYGRPRLSPLAARPESEASATTSSLLARWDPAPDYAPTGGSPPKLSDLTEGSGKVKYLPRGWLETFSPSTPSPAAKYTRPAPTPYRQTTPPSDPPLNFMPGFEERLETINLSLDKPTTPEMKDLDTAENKEVVDMILAIQQKADSGISSLTRELKELSQWIKDQLSNQVTNVRDLQRTDAQFDSRQREISQNMRKLKLDMEVKMGVMDQRLVTVESRLGEGTGQRFHSVESKLDEGADQHTSLVDNRRWEDLNAELHKVALSMQDLTQRTEDAIKRWTAGSDKAAKLMKKQEAHIVQMENEIAELHQKQANQPKSLPYPGFAQRFVGESTTTSTEPLIKQPESPLPPMRISPLPRSVTAIPSRQREMPPAKSKTSSVIPRSLSMKKGLSKVDSNSPESRSKIERVGSAEHSKSKVGGTEESKKWNIFSFRRRDTKNEDPENGSSKLSWLPRRSRDGRPSDNASSRSVTPPPPIPRNILQNIENNIQAASQIHPALRNRVQQAVMHDESLSIPSTPSTATMPARMGSRLSRPDSQHMGVITASVAPSLASSYDLRAASGDLCSPDRYRFNKDPFMQVPKTPIAIRSIEDMRRPLLNRADDESHDWDRCSLHEAKSTASLR